MEKKNYSKRFNEIIESAKKVIESVSTNKVYTYEGEVFFMSIVNGSYPSEWGCEIEDGEFRGLDEEGGEPINYMDFEEINPESICNIADSIDESAKFSAQLEELRKDIYDFIKTNIRQRTIYLHDIKTYILDEDCDFRHVNIVSIRGFKIKNIYEEEYNIKHDITIDNLAKLVDDIIKQL